MQISDETDRIKHMNIAEDYKAILAYFCPNYLQAIYRHYINCWNWYSAVKESSTSYNLWMVRNKPDPTLPSSSPVVRVYGKTGVRKCDNLLTKLDMSVAVNRHWEVKRVSKFPCNWKCGHTIKSYEIPSFPGACIKMRICALPVNWAGGPVLKGLQAT